MEINRVVGVISSPATVATTVAPSVHQEMSDEGTQEELPNAEELLLPLIPLPITRNVTRAPHQEDAH